MEFASLVSGNNSIKNTFNSDVINKTIIRNESTQKFIVFNSRVEFEQWYYKQDQKCFHEVIFGESIQRIKFDIDITVEKIDIDNVITKILNTIIATLNTVYDLSISREDFIITDSSGKEGKYKYSYHIILYKYAVANNNEAKYITSLVVEQLPDYVSFIDTLVNKSIQNFRILHSTKYGSNRVKIITCKYGTYNGSLLDSLIVPHNGIKVLKECFCKTDNQYSTSLLTDKIYDNILEKLNELGVTNGHSLRCINGNSIQFNRIKPTYCKICDETHHHDNSLIVNYENNILYEFCRQAGKSVKICKYALSSEAALTTALTTIQQPSLPIQQQFGTKFDLLPNKHVYSESEMRPYEHVTNLAVKAQMKLGKTKTLHNHLKNYYNSDSVIIFVTFRQTFSNHVYNLFNDFELYSNIKGNIDTNHNKKLIIQVESLYRINIDSNKIDLLILDESESIFGQLGSGLHKNFSASFATFSWLLKYSRNTICMDANLSDRTYNILTKFRQDPITYHYNTWKPCKDDTYHVTLDKNIWLNHLVDKCDKNIVIVTNSITEAKACEYLIKSQYPNKSIKLFSSETKYSEKQLMFGNVHKYWSDLDVLIYTPTCSAGVSYELEHFDVIFGYFCNSSCDVETCRQMLGRVRNIKSKEYYICLQQSEYYELPTTSSDIHNYLYNKRNIMIKTIKESGIPYTYDIDGNIKFYETEYYYVWLENMAIQNMSKSNFIYRFIDQIRETGAKIIRSISGDVPENGEDIKKIIEKQKDMAIANAKDIDMSECTDILNKLVHQKDIEIEEFHSYEKYKLKKYYDCTNITYDFVRQYNKRNVKQIYKNLTDITKYETINESLQQILKKEYERFTTIVDSDINYKSKHEYYDLKDDKINYTSMSHKIISNIISLFGINPIPNDRFDELLNTIWPSIEEHKRNLSIEHNVNFETNKSTILNNLLRNMYGLRFYKNNKNITLKKCNGLGTLFEFKEQITVSEKIVILTKNRIFLLIN